MRDNTKTGITNAMTIDVEDYFHVSAFESVVSPKDWDSMQCRIERNMDLILNLFDQHRVKATFFVLGWIAERYPHIVKKIVAEGHELASHGSLHRRATEQSREEFSKDVGDAKKCLEDIGGTRVDGYRAPSFSFNRENNWTYSVLSELGYQYSSSVYPVKRDLYGIPDAPRTMYMEQGDIHEIPLSTLKVNNKNMPISGGGFFRLYPYFITKHGISTLNQKERLPYIFYLHPWELDPKQPRIPGASAKSRFRHYLNLSRVESRLSRLLEDFDWSTMQDVFLPKTTSEP